MKSKNNTQHVRYSSRREGVERPRQTKQKKNMTLKRVETDKFTIPATGKTAEDSISCVNSPAHIFYNGACVKCHLVQNSQDVSIHEDERKDSSLIKEKSDSVNLDSLRGKSHLQIAQELWEEISAYKNEWDDWDDLGHLSISGKIKRHAQDCQMFDIFLGELAIKIHVDKNLNMAIPFSAFEFFINEREDIQKALKFYKEKGVIN